MKAKLILMFVIICVQANAQYSNYNIGVKSGAVIGNESVGNGFSYGFDFQRHLFKGLYASLSYQTGHSEAGDQVVFNVDEIGFHPTTMRQFSLFGLGIGKEMQISNNGSAKLSFEGLYISQRRVDWESSTGFNASTSVRDLNEMYGQRQDIGFNISLEYLHNINHLISLGIYGQYTSQPQLFGLGFRMVAHLRKDPEVNSSSPRKNDIKNWIEIRRGLIAGDGTPIVGNFTLEYGRQLHRIISTYVKFSVGKGSDFPRSLDLNTLTEEEQEVFTNNFLTSDNEAGNIAFHPAQSYNLGAGAKVIINSDGKSIMSLSSGIGYYRGAVVRTSSGGSSLETYSENFRLFTDVTAEVGLHYDYNWTDNFYLGFKLDFATVRFNFGAGVHAGFRF